MHPITDRPAILPALVVAGLTLGLAGCGSDSTGTGGELAPDQVASIGGSVSREVESSIALATVGGVEGNIITGRRVVDAGVSLMRTWSPAASVSRATTSGDCPTRSPASPVDTDHDGVPDQVTFTFVPSSCTFSFSNGQMQLSGSVSVNDPAPSDSGLSLNASATNFQVSLTSGAQSLIVTRTGSWSGAASSGGLSNTLNVTTTVHVTGRPDIEITDAWSGTFTPDAGQSIFMGHPLPAGSYTVSGSIQVTDGTSEHALSLVTVTRLHYQPDACSGHVSPFGSGEVRAVLSGSHGRGYVRIVWSNCDTPTYTFVATNA